MAKKKIGYEKFMKGIKSRLFSNPLTIQQKLVLFYTRSKFSFAYKFRMDIIKFIKENLPDTANLLELYTDEDFIFMNKDKVDYTTVAVDRKSCIDYSEVHFLSSIITEKIVQDEQKFRLNISLPVNDEILGLCDNHVYTGILINKVSICINKIHEELPVKEITSIDDIDPKDAIKRCILDIDSTGKARMYWLDLSTEENIQKYKDFIQLTVMQFALVVNDILPPQNDNSGYSAPPVSKEPGDSNGRIVIYPRLPNSMIYAYLYSKSIKTENLDNIGKTGFYTLPDDSMRFQTSYYNDNKIHNTNGELVVGDMRVKGAYNLLPGLFIITKTLEDNEEFFKERYPLLRCNYTGRLEKYAQLHHANPYYFIEYFNSTVYCSGAIRKVPASTYVYSILSCNHPLDFPVGNMYLSDFDLYTIMSPASMIYALKDPIKNMSFSFINLNSKSVIKLLRKKLFTADMYTPEYDELYITSVHPLDKYELIRQCIPIYQRNRQLVYHNKEKSFPLRRSNPFDKDICSSIYKGYLQIVLARMSLGSNTIKIARMLRIIDAGKYMKLKMSLTDAENLPFIERSIYNFVNKYDNLAELFEDVITDSTHYSILQDLYKDYLYTKKIDSKDIRFSTAETNEFLHKYVFCGNDCRILSSRPNDTRIADFTVVGDVNNERYLTLKGMIIVNIAPEDYEEYKPGDEIGNDNIILVPTNYRSKDGDEILKIFRIKDSIKLKKIIYNADNVDDGPISGSTVMYLRNSTKQLQKISSTDAVVRNGYNEYGGEMVALKFSNSYVEYI